MTNANLFRKLGAGNISKAIYACVRSIRSENILCVGRGNEGLMSILRGIFLAIANMLCVLPVFGYVNVVGSHELTVADDYMISNGWFDRAAYCIVYSNGLSEWRYSIDGTVTEPDGTVYWYVKTRTGLAEILVYSPYKPCEHKIGTGDILTYDPYAPNASWTPLDKPKTSSVTSGSRHFYFFRGRCVKCGAELMSVEHAFSYVNVPMDGRRCHWVVNQSSNATMAVKGVYCYDGVGGKYFDTNALEVVYANVSEKVEVPISCQYLDYERDGPRYKPVTNIFTKVFSILPKGYRDDLVLEYSCSTLDTSSHPVVITPQELGTSEPGEVKFELSCPWPDAKIYYTYDNTAPSAKNGFLYSGSITEYEERHVRARAFVDGVGESKEVDFIARPGKGDPLCKIKFRDDPDGTFLDWSNWRGVTDSGKVVTYRLLDIVTTNTHHKVRGSGVTNCVIYAQIDDVTHRSQEISHAWQPISVSPTNFEFLNAGGTRTYQVAPLGCKVESPDEYLGLSTPTNQAIGWMKTSTTPSGFDLKVYQYPMGFQREGSIFVYKEPTEDTSWPRTEIRVVQHAASYLPSPVKVATDAPIYPTKIDISWTMPYMGEYPESVWSNMRFNVYRAETQDGNRVFLGETKEMTYIDEPSGLQDVYYYWVEAISGEIKSEPTLIQGTRCRIRTTNELRLEVGSDATTRIIELAVPNECRIGMAPDWVEVSEIESSGRRAYKLSIAQAGPYSRRDYVVIKCLSEYGWVHDSILVCQKGTCHDVDRYSILAPETVMAGGRIELQSEIRYDDGSSYVVPVGHSLLNGYVGLGARYFLTNTMMGVTISEGGAFDVASSAADVNIDVFAEYEEYGITNKAVKSVKIIAKKTLRDSVAAPFELTCFDVTGVPGWNPTAADAHAGDCSVVCKRPSILKGEVNRGVLSFWCKLSPEFVKLSGMYGQYLEVCVNNKVVKTLSREDAAEWTQFQILIQEDNSVVSWRYCYAGSKEEFGTVYLDDISLNPVILTRLEIDGPDRILSRIDPTKLSGETAVYDVVAVYNGIEDQKVAYDGALWSATGSGASIVGGDIGRSCRIVAEDVSRDQQLVLRVADANAATVFAEKTISVKYIEPEVAIATALDCPTLKFAVGGADAWRGVLSASKVGESSARSTLMSATNSWIQTSVPWGGTLSFWIKGTGGSVDLQVDGETAASYGLTDVWCQKTVVLNKGAHTVRWVHRSDKSVAVSAWLDGVDWSQDAPQLQLITITSAVDSRLKIGETATLYCRAEYDYGEPKFVSPVWSIPSGDDHAALSGNVLSAMSVGTVSVKAEYEEGGVARAFSRMYDIIGADENLSSAVGCASLSFTTGGDAIWHHQSKTYYDVGGAAQSGDLGEGQSCWMETVINGPCKLTWYWKNDSWGTGDELQVFVDGVVWSKTGGTAWTMAAINLGEDREFCVKWLYQNMSGAWSGLRHGWIDRVRIEELDTPTVVRSISIEGPVRAIDAMIHDYKCYAKYDNGQTARVKPIWSVVAGSDFCNIDDSGCFWAWGVGSARIKATYSFGGKTCTGYFDLEVVKTLAGLQVIGEGSVPAGSHRVYKCRAIYGDGSEADVCGKLSIASIYRANDPNTNGFARLEAYGILYACTNDVGYVVLRAVYSESGITLTNDMKVAVSIPDEVSLKIEGDSVVRYGTSEQYKAILTFGEDSLRAEVSPTWSIIKGAEYATISTAGVLTPKSSGNVRLQAYNSWGKLMVEYKDVAIATSGTNKGALQSIYIQGSSSAEYGSDAQYRCFGIYENGSVAAVTAIWQVTNCGTNGWMTDDGVLKTAPLEGRTGSAIVKASVGALIATKSISLTIHYEEIPIGLALGGGLQYERTDPTNWFGQTFYSYDGEGAVRTRLNTSVRSSSIKSEVLGPGRLSFKWSQKAETAYRRMLFLIDGVQVAAIQKSNDYGWKEIEQDIPEGRHELEWRYVSDSVNKTADWFVIDDVVWEKVPKIDRVCIWGDEVLRAGSLSSNVCLEVYDTGLVLTNHLAQWRISSGAEWVELVDESGTLLAGAHEGWATLAVRCEVDGDEFTAQREVFVQKRPVSIEITGGATIGLWHTEMYSCFVTYSDMSRERINPSWSIEAGDATINQFGNLIANNGGQVIIRADYDDETGHMQTTYGVNVVSMSECVNLSNAVLSARGGSSWLPERGETHDGSLSLTACSASSAITSVYGSGEFRFWWRIATGRVRVFVDEKECVCLSDVTGWKEHGVAVEGDGLHYIEWRYENGSNDGSCWLDEFSWIPRRNGNIVPADVTGGKEIIVEEAWPMSLDAQFGAGTRAAFVEKFGSDLSAALLKPTGKKNAVGEDMYIWQDYVAGTDPTDPKSQFTAKIEMVDGEPVVVWSPKLSEAEAAKRVYTTYGKKTLEAAEPWTPVETPAQGGWRFFKVGVEMR